MISIYKDFLGFLKSPIEKKAENQTAANRFRHLFALLIAELPIMFVLILIIVSLESLGLIDTSSHKLNSLIHSMPLLLTFILLVIIIPFFEELVFRLYLKFRLNLPVFLLIKIGTNFRPYDEVKSRYENMWRKHYFYIFYFAALLFGFVHILNYEITLTVILLMPLLVAPQFVIGVFIGYLRVKFNLLTGFYLHSIHNAIFLFVAFFALGSSVEIVNVKTDEYNLLIQEERLVTKNALYSFNENNIQVNDGSFEIIMSYLLEKDESQIEISNDDILNKSFNIEMKYFSASENINSILLNYLQESYRFEIDTLYRLQDIFYLDIIDSALISEHINRETVSNSTTTISNNSLVLKNVNLTILTSALTRNYQEYFKSTNIEGDFYDFEFPVDNFEELRNTLSETYGIGLTKQAEKVEINQIRFP
jgi:membrane protease YdiL (CAAX protease family)